MNTEAFLTAQVLSFRSRETTTALNRHHRKRPQTPAVRTARMPFVAKARDATELEDRLISTVLSLQESLPEASLHKYRTKRPEDFAAAIAATVELERTGLGFGRTIKGLSSLLPGTWRLILTNAKAVEKNAGSITGLGNLPGAQCTNVEIRLERGGKASTVERVKVLGLLDGENALEGKWRVDGDKLEVTYAKAILMGKAKLRADSKAVLRTSYCSQRVRIGRSASGELYVFVKE